MEASVLFVPSDYPSVESFPIQRLAELSREFLSIATTSASEEERYHRVLSSVHEICASIIECEREGHSREEIVEVLRDVRELHAASPFVDRLQRWPRGYPGDFETVEYICRAENHAVVGTLAHACEAYALSRSIAQQHRNKVQHQANRILSTMLAKPGASRVLSLAAGSCADLQLLVPFLSTIVGELFLNDADEGALEFSRRALSEVGAACTFLPGNALRVVKRLQRQERFDLVLAGGLFDYLPKDHAIYVMKNVYDGLLREGGTFFFTNIAENNPYRALIEYFGDWFLIERTEKELLAYCDEAGIAAGNIKITREQTGLAYLVEIRRN
jgi:extracellular factor (EF) 3-hydroxypalmitic acid methyl ester biosynthesis protein